MCITHSTVFHDRAKISIMGMWWIMTVIIVAVALFFLKDISRMKRMQSETRTAYLEEGLAYDQANRVAWYLIQPTNVTKSLAYMIKRGY